MALKLAIVVILFFSTVNTAAAIGISPAKKVFDFEPNKEVTAVFRIVNNEDLDMNIEIDVSGPLEQYISYPTNPLRIFKNESHLNFDVTVKIPASFELPGLHESNIIIMASEITEETTSISTAQRITSKLQIRVPYPGKYIESKLILQETDNGLRAILPVFNYGYENIKEAFATVDILDKSKKIISKSTTLKTDIDSGSQMSLSKNIEINQKGSYLVDSEINYDGNKLKLSKDFNFKSPYINLTNIYSDEFIHGDVTQITLELTSDWNEQIEGATLLFSLGNGNEESIIHQSDEFNLSSYGITKQFFYWDTKEFEIGKYNASIKVETPIGTTSHHFDIVVGVDSIQSKYKGKQAISLSILLILGGFSFTLLAILITIWLRHLQRSRKGNRKKRRK
jgi:hypothetical protein